MSVQVKYLKDENNNVFSNVRVQGFFINFINFINFIVIGY